MRGSYAPGAGSAAARATHKSAPTQPLTQPSYSPSVSPSVPADVTVDDITKAMQTLAANGFSAVFLTENKE